MSAWRNATRDKSDEKSFVHERFLGKVAAAETVTSNLDDLQQRHIQYTATIYFHVFLFFHSAAYLDHGCIIHGSFSLLSAEPRGPVPHLCQFTLWMCRVPSGRTQRPNLKASRHTAGIGSWEEGRKAPPHRCDCLNRTVLHHVKQSWWRTARLQF